jgi:hypothetical protein
MTVGCAVLRLRALAALLSVRLISNRPIVEQHYFCYYS